MKTGKRSTEFNREEKYLSGGLDEVVWGPLGTTLAQRIVYKWIK